MEDQQREIWKRIAADGGDVPDMMGCRTELMEERASEIRKCTLSYELMKGQKLKFSLAITLTRPVYGIFCFHAFISALAPVDPPRTLDFTLSDLCYDIAFGDLCLE